MRSHNALKLGIVALLGATGADAQVYSLHSESINADNYEYRATVDLKTPAELNIWEYRSSDPDYLGVWQIENKAGEYLASTYWQKDLLELFEPVEQSRLSTPSSLAVFGTQTIGYKFSGADLRKAVAQLASSEIEKFERFAKDILTPLFAKHGDDFVLRVTSWQTPVLQRARLFERLTTWTSPGRISMPTLAGDAAPVLFLFREDIPYLKLSPRPVPVDQLFGVAEKQLGATVQKFVRSGSLFEPQAAVVYEIQELPRVYTLVAQKQLTMNRMMIRASAFAEGDGEFPPGQVMPLDHKLYPFAVAGVKGHDVRGVHLRQLCEAIDKDNWSLTAEERLLRSEVLEPLFKRHGDDFVLLGVSLQTASDDALGVYGHELLHAQHFTQPRLDEALWKYWRDTPAARAATIAGLEYLGYNTKNETNNVTEMWAYTFDPASSKPGRPAPIAAIHNTCAESLLASTREAGFDPVTNRLSP